MKTQNILTILAAVILSVIVTLQFVPDQTGSSQQESVYDKVMRTKTLRCGYVNYNPVVYNNPKTGEMEGVMVDALNEIGKSLDLKIEWTAEIGFADIVEGFRSDRFDALCIGVWRSPNEGKYIDYTKSLFTSYMAVYARADDHRFDAGFETINNPNARIVFADGMLAQYVSEKHFPNAKHVAMPNLTTQAQMFEDIVTNKADIILAEGYTANGYMKNNPGKVRNVFPDTPIRVFQSTIGIPMGEVKLRAMLNSAIIYLTDSGIMDDIIDHYAEHPGLIKIRHTQYKPEDTHN